MVHPDTELRFIRPEIGHGLVATRPIPCGSLIWIMDDLDQVFAPEALASLPAAGREAVLRYSARKPSGDLVLFWDHARFINHSCSPASLIAGWHISIAVRAISAEEEITEDYALLNLLPEETFACQCGGERCRGRIGPDDVLAKGAEWAEALRRALALMDGVPQPLWALMRDEYLVEARAACGLDRHPEPRSR